jgi:hypothetical protein
MEPQYGKYTFEELLDVHQHIDRDAYPDRFLKISKLIAQKKNDMSCGKEYQNEEGSSADNEDEGIYTKPPIRNIDKEGNYIPNNIPIKERVSNLVISILLLTYGLYGLYKGEIHIPGKRGNGIYLYGESVWIMFVGLICGIVVFVSIVMDHYDKRDNEHKYYEFGKTIKYLGIGCFVVAVIWELIRR